MGASKWGLHQRVIRGKSGLVDHIVDNAKLVGVPTPPPYLPGSMQILGSSADRRKHVQQDGIKKIALKEHSFTPSALETTLKYFYDGGWRRCQLYFTYFLLTVGRQRTRRKDRSRRAPCRLRSLGISPGFGVPKPHRVPNRQSPCQYFVCPHRQD